MQARGSYRFRVLRFVFLFCSVVGGEPLRAQGSWVALHSPTQQNLYKLQFLDSLRGWVIGSQGAIFKTTDGGQSWIDESIPVTSDMGDIFMLTDSLGWVIAMEIRPDSPWYVTTLYKTRNGGQQWSLQTFLDEAFNTVWFMDSSRGWRGGWRGKLLGTTDGGTSWFDAVVDSFMFVSFDVLNIKFFTPQYGYAIGGRRDRPGILWRTTDAGQRWIPMSLSDTCRLCDTCDLDTCYFSISPEPIFDAHSFDSLNIICLGGDPEWGASLLRTSDGGANWAYTWLGIYGEARSVSFRTGAEGWVPLGFSATMMYTTDSGNSWRDTTTPTGFPVYDVAFVDTTTGYMVGAQGAVLKYLGPAVGVREEGAPRPSVHRLYQNYPNPFNPSTTIRYDLATDAHVTILIHDVMGREVAKLFDGPQSAGSHEVHFDAGNLAGGVYFCTLKAGPAGAGTGQVFVTRKLLLIK